MAVEATRELSIPDLLHLLNDKLDLEYSRLREARPTRVDTASSVESEVRTCWSI